MLDDFELLLRHKPESTYQMDLNFFIAKLSRAMFVGFASHVTLVDEKSNNNRKQPEKKLDVFIGKFTSYPLLGN